MAAKLRLVSETPGWWNPRGHNMHVSISGTLLTGAKADLALRSTSSTPVYVLISQVFRRDKYTLTWHVTHSGGHDPHYSEGGLEVNSLEIYRMFALNDGVEKADEWMLEQYRATTAVHGKFVRQGRYLNISGPGTGRDGDANMSIFVSDGIAEAVRSMLMDKRHQSA